MIQFTLDKNCGMPFHEQLKSQLISCLYMGKLKEGDRLPSIREMAKDLGINYKTVHKIFRKLEEEAYLEVRRGSGVFIRKQHAGEFRALRQQAILKLIKDSLDRARRIGLSEAKFIGLLNTYVHGDHLKRLTCAVVDHEEEAVIFSAELAKRLGVRTIPVSLTDCEQNGRSVADKLKEANYLLTTSWHLNEVKALADRYKKKVLEIKPNPEIYKEILEVVRNKNAGIVVQDPHTMHASTEVFMQIFYPSTAKKFFITAIDDTERLEELIREADIIYVSPLCWDAMRKLTPRHVELKTFENFISEESLETLRQIQLFS
ncbi:MAG: GntR family transcriptional regulator [Acidobacteria bacterium]|nr:GntR family transcriptional regulator [Acidobacteriota bacterium]